MANGRLLLVDPDPSVGAQIGSEAAAAGYAFAQLPGDADVVAVVLRAPPDLLLLELRLSGLSGLEVLRRLRDESGGSDLPVVMLAEGAEEVDRVAAFLLGADDFVDKPFSARELLLRCSAILRRVRRGAESGAPRWLEVGPVRVNLPAHRVRVAGKEVRLTHLEFRLLRTLLVRADRVQSRETLLADVWGMRSDVSTRTVDTHVRRLRRKLGVAAAHLETVRGVGYRFSSRISARSLGK